VNHQGEDRLPRVLAALAASERVVDDVVVVDSGSTDGSLELIARRYPAVRVFSLGRNLGPAAARNRGFDVARHDRILFVDNDVVVEPACLDHLDRALSSRDDAVLAMPRVLDATDPSRIHFEGAEAHCLGQLVPRLRAEADRRNGRAASSPLDDAGASGGPALEVGSMISACFLVDRARADGLRFDPVFEFNYEDHDFGLRCRSAGLTLLAVPAARCRHGAGTPGYSVRRGREDPSERLRRMVMARWLVVHRCYARRTMVLLAPALALFEVVQWAWLARSGRLDAWRAARGALRERAPEIQRARAEVERRRRVRDGHLLTAGALPIRESVAGGPLERAVLAALGGASAIWWRLVRRMA
jgi:GT2 family glycosyltransferase